MYTPGTINEALTMMNDGLLICTTQEVALGKVGEFEVVANIATFTNIRNDVVYVDYTTEEKR